MPETIWPLLLYFGGVLIVIIGMLAISYALGQRHNDSATGEIYESGIIPTGSGRLRFSAQFYLVALSFLVFDLEAVFIFAWAIAFREVGWSGYAGVMFFIFILAVVLIYEWRMGALDWGPSKPNRTRK